MGLCGAEASLGSGAGGVLVVTRVLLCDGWSEQMVPWEELPG